MTDWVNEGELQLHNFALSLQKSIAAIQQPPDSALWPQEAAGAPAQSPPPPPPPPQAAEVASGGGGGRMVSPARSPEQPPIVFAEETLTDRLHRLGMAAKAKRMRAESPPPAPAAAAVRAPSLWDLGARGRDLYVDAECRRRMLLERITQKERLEEERRSQPILAPHSVKLAQKRREREVRALFDKHASSPDAGVGRLSYTGLVAALREVGALSTGDPRGDMSEEDKVVCDRAWCAMYDAQKPGEEGSAYIRFREFSQVILRMFGDGGAASGGGDGPALTERDRNVVKLQVMKRQEMASKRLATPSWGKAGCQAKQGEDYKCSFNPAISDKSRKIMRTQTEQPRRYLSLSDTHRREARLNEARRERMEKEAETCTFQPAINRKSLKIAAEVAEGGLTAPPQRKHKQTKERHEELELQECTFEPKTNTYKKSKDRPLPNGYFEVIKRLREKRAVPASFEDNLRSSSPQPSQQQRGGGGGRSSSCSRTTKPRPFNLRLAKKNEPLLYLDVQLPRGRRGRIGIQEGDSAAGLARSFATANQLSSKTEATLLKVLEEHIATLVPRLAAAARSEAAAEAGAATRVAAEFARSAAQLERFAEEAEEQAERLDAAAEEAEAAAAAGGLAAPLRSRLLEDSAGCVIEGIPGAAEAAAAADEGAAAAGAAASEEAAGRSRRASVGEGSSGAGEEDDDNDNDDLQCVDDMLQEAFTGDDRDNLRAVLGDDYHVSMDALQGRGSSAAAASVLPMRKLHQPLRQPPPPPQQPQTLRSSSGFAEDVEKIVQSSVPLDLSQDAYVDPHADGIQSLFDEITKMEQRYGLA